MNLKKDINALKGEMKAAISEWMEEKVNDFVASRPALKPVSIYIKRGFNHWLDTKDMQINKTMDMLLPCICDKDGNIDTDQLLDDAAEMFRMMDEHTTQAGPVKLVVGKGAIVVGIDNPIADMLLGGKAVRISVDEMLELKDLLK